MFIDNRHDLELYKGRFPVCAHVMKLGTGYRLYFYLEEVLLDKAKNYWGEGFVQLDEVLFSGLDHLTSP